MQDTWHETRIYEERRGAIRTGRVGIHMRGENVSRCVIQDIDILHDRWRTMMVTVRGKRQSNSDIRY